MTTSLDREVLSVDLRLKFHDPKFITVTLRAQECWMLKVFGSWGKYKYLHKHGLESG